MIIDNLKYRTFSELMASVSSDMDTYADNLMIDDFKFIKTVRRVNADIGIRINNEKEVMLDIINHRVILPDDFMYLQLAMLCYANPGSAEITRGVDPSKIANISGCEVCSKNCTPKDCNSKCDNKSELCTNCLVVNEHIGYDLTIRYDTLYPVKLTKKSYKFCADSCMNLSITSDKYKFTLDISENIMTLDGIKNGKLYLNYITDMVNEDGELLIVDHPLVNDFYEYAVKTKMLENFLLNDKAVNVQGKLQLANERLKEARIEAMNFVYMPEYTELLNYGNAKKSNFYKKYIKIFNNI